MLVDGVHGWQETSSTSKYFYISNEKSSAGEQSLKLTSASSQPLIFAHWNFAEALALQDNLEISMDVYPPGGSTTLYWKIMSNNAYAAYIIVQENYVFPAVVNLVNPVPIAMAAINVGEFNQIKLKFNYTEETITYYANEVQIHQGELWGSKEAIDQYSFEAFLFEDLFLDNFQTNVLVGAEAKMNIPFTHYIQNNSLNLKSAVNLEEIEIYDILGKRVHSEYLSNPQESIAISYLNSGVYIARLKMNNQWHSLKFMK